MKVRLNQVLQAARDAGFTAACPLSMDALQFHEETRQLCEQNLCGKYGRNWSCPPNCPSLAQTAELVAGYGSGVLVQTKGLLAYEDDRQGIEVLRNEHNRRFYGFAERLKGIYGDVLPMGSGECRICRECSCPEAPCRHPDRRVSAMEAYGLYVSEVCAASGMDFLYHGDDRLMMLVGCVLLP